MCSHDVHFRQLVLTEDAEISRLVSSCTLPWQETSAGRGWQMACRGPLSRHARDTWSVMWPYPSPMCYGINKISHGVSWHNDIGLDAQLRNARKGLLIWISIGSRVSSMELLMMVVILACVCLEAVCFPFEYSAQQIVPCGCVLIVHSHVSSLVAWWFVSIGW